MVSSRSPHSPLDAGDAPESDVKQLFIEAIRLPDGQPRRELLDRACRERPQLRAQVERLLAVREEAVASPLDQVVERLEAMTDTSAEAASRVESLVPQQIGPYQLLKQLGQGGMGAVYLARQTHPVRREVALKLIRPGMDSQEITRRFEAERQALALMNHPHIARILDAGVAEDGRSFFVMELVVGQPIDEYCERNDLPLKDRLRLFVDVCRAVQHAHRNGVLHRDLKPSNVLVATHDGRPVVKVIDFGVAKALGGDLTEAPAETVLSQFIGTPLYVSPEQTEMGKVAIDTRSDVYSLGVLLYKLLTGSTPFSSEQLREAGFDDMRRIIREQEPPRPSSRLSTIRLSDTSTIHSPPAERPARRVRIDNELDWIVMKAIEKDRERRYESPADFSDDILRYLANEPVMACPPSLLYRSRKALRRNRVALAISCVIAVALLTTSAVSLWGLMEVNEAWRESLRREQQANQLLEASVLQTTLPSFRESKLLQLNLDLAPLDELRQSQVESGESLSGSPSSLETLLRNAAQVKPLSTILHEQPIHDLDVSTDGSRMVSVDKSGVVRLYELAQGYREPVSMQVLGTLPATTDAVSISPNGKIAVTGSITGAVLFWDLENPGPPQFKAATRNGVETIVWSPDGNHLAVGSRYKEVLLLDSDGNVRHRIPNDQRHEALLFSRDNRSLYVPTREDIFVWDVATGEKSGVLPTGKLTDVRIMCWAGPHRRWLLLGNRYSESLVVVDPDRAETLHQFQVGVAYPQDVVALKDGSWLVAVYPDGRATLLSLADGFEGKVSSQVVATFAAHDQPGGRLVVDTWTDAEGHFFSAGADGRIHRWNAFRTKTWDQGPRGSFVGGHLTDRGLSFMYAKEDRRYGPPYRYRRDLERWEPFGPPPPVDFAGFHANGPGDIAVIGWQHVSVRDGQTGEVLMRQRCPFEEPRHVFLTDDRWLVACARRRAAAWKPEPDGTWRLAWEREFVLQVEDDTSSRRVIAAPQDRRVLIQFGAEAHEVDLASGESVRVYPIAGRAQTALSRDGRWLAGLTVDAALQVIDRASGHVVFEKRRAANVLAMAFSPDSQILATGEADGSVYAWHVPTERDLGLLFRPLISLGEPELMEWSGDSRQILITYHNGGSARSFILLGRDEAEPTVQHASSP